HIQHGGNVRVEQTGGHLGFLYETRKGFAIGNQSRFEHLECYRAFEHLISSLIDISKSATAQVRFNSITTKLGGCSHHSSKKRLNCVLIKAYQRAQRKPI